MAILSDCTSCKVVDQVRTISHTPPARWETGASLPLDFKLFKATYEVHSLGKLWPAKSHLGPQRALDLWRLWWINLRGLGSSVCQTQEGNVSKTFDLFSGRWFYFQPAVAAHWHFQMFKCSFVITETDGFPTLTPPPLELPIPFPNVPSQTLSFSFCHWENSIFNLDKSNWWGEHLNSLLTF